MAANNRDATSTNPVPDEPTGELTAAEIRLATARAIKEALLNRRQGNYYPIELEYGDFAAVFKEYGV